MICLQPHSYPGNIPDFAYTLNWSSLLHQRVLAYQLAWLAPLRTKVDQDLKRMMTCANGTEGIRRLRWPFFDVAGLCCLALRTGNAVVAAWSGVDNETLRHWSMYIAVVVVEAC